MHMYDRRLRWSVPRWLPERIAGRTIDALDRRSKYLLFRVATDTLLVHFGMTGSLRAFTRPAAARAARSRRHRARFGRDAALPRSATLRRDALAAGARRRPSAARVRSARSRSTRPATPHYLWTRDATPDGGDQARADGQSSRRRRWQYLRQRIAVPRRNPADDPGESRVASPARRASSTRSARRSTTPSQRAARRCATTSTAAASPATSSSTTSSTDAQGLPCRVCGTAIREIRQGGRATYYCPRCQR